MGSLYRRKLRNGNLNRVWWAKYYRDGRPVRETTGVVATGLTPPAAAKRFLKQREGRVALNLPVVPRMDRVMWAEAREDLRTHYEATGSRDLREFARRVQHLDRFFAGRRIASIGQQDVDRYVVERQAQGRTSGTIRRELGTLTKLLRVAYKNQKLARLPLLDKPKEGPAREGFFEPAQFEAVRRRLPEDLQVALAISYTLGWRMQSEVLRLERRHVDLEAGSVRLDPGMTKNGDGRVAYLTPQLSTLLAGQLDRVRALERRLGRIVSVLFPHGGQGARAGQPRRDFRKAWGTACQAAGVPGRYRHDLRRTAVRNMERRGVPRSIAMKITGHRTESVYRRYAIVSDADLLEAARRLTGTLAGTPPAATLTPAP